MSKRIVTEIWIYPIKSLGGVRLQSSPVLPKGLAYDRRWMLVDNGNVFMTQRDYPQMALLKLSLDLGNFTIRYNDEKMDLTFEHCNDRIAATVWNDIVEVFEVSRSLSQWISQILGVNCRLVSFPENNPRPVEAEFSINHDHVSLADAYPLLIIGENSLEDLNRRMKEPLPMNRFRPNIVFSGGEPYEED
ncbi:MAG: MOSC N-terminal beta barrel domain-containing protein, partial [Chitinophagaceae bacterium]|nr:MOSC N-terminal beta barrel domain-containing protein [Chitinophagaceae bacterium]